MSTPSTSNSNSNSSIAGSVLVILLAVFLIVKYIPGSFGGVIPYLKGIFDGWALTPEYGLQAGITVIAVALVVISAFHIVSAILGRNMERKLRVREMQKQQRALNREDNVPFTAR